MTWLEFKNAVKVFITVDAVRLNTGALVEQLTRQAVIDLQSYCEDLRFPHQTIYTPADLTDDGLASTGTLPDQAILRDAFFVKDSDIDGGVNNQCAQSPMEQYPWSSRQDLVCANVSTTGCRYKIAVSPQATTFFVFPQVEDGYHLSLFWEGQRIDFDDGTLVPFGERSVMAAAMWVKAGVIREIDRDPQLAASYIGNPRIPGTYMYLRSLAYLDGRDRRRFVDSGSSPQAEANCANVLACTPVPA